MSQKQEIQDLKDKVAELEKKLQAHGICPTCGKCNHYHYTYPYYYYYPYFMNGGSSGVIGTSGAAGSITYSTNASQLSMQSGIEYGQNQ